MWYKYPHFIRHATVYFYFALNFADGDGFGHLESVVISIEIRYGVQCVCTSTWLIWCGWARLNFHPKKENASTQNIWNQKRKKRLALHSVRRLLWHHDAISLSENGTNRVNVIGLHMWHSGTNVIFFFCMPLARGARNRNEMHVRYERAKNWTIETQRTDCSTAIVRGVELRSLWCEWINLQHCSRCVLACALLLCNICCCICHKLRN